MIAIILSVLKFCGLDILPKVIEAYNKKADTLVENNKTTAQVAIAMMQAESDAAQAKTKYLSTGDWVVHFMILLFACPVALHWAMICLDSTFRFGWGIPAMPGMYGDAEVEIVKSFFNVGVGAAAVMKVASIIKR